MHWIGQFLIKQKLSF